MSVGYLIYFLKARLFEAGPEITRKEWFYVVAMLVLMVLGTINIRMAEMRQRNQGTLPLVDPPRALAQMTTRIDRRFADLQREGRAALVTFTMAGDPDYENLA